jgi:Domain of unknown function (DUF6468)
MMLGMTLGMLVEGSVAVLLALTLGYCVVLNGRLKRLHDDRDSLKVMVADLINATNLANSAIKELKTTAVEADLALGSRLEEAERFGIELANHVSAGASLMDRIAKITSVARHSQSLEPAPEEAAPNRVQSALQQLASRPRMRGTAA